jgi:hypothetical protein
MFGEVYNLILTEFLGSSTRAIEWVMQREPDHLLLDLPVELTSSVRRLALEDGDPEEFWREYAFLTGLEEPYLNAIRRSRNIIIDSLPILMESNPGLRLFCYLDLEEHLKSTKLVENLLLLETAEKVRRNINVKSWRRLLSEEANLAISSLEKISANIFDMLKKDGKNVVFGGRFPNSLIRYLSLKGYEVRLIYLQSYWKPPLDILRAMSQIYPVEEIPDEIIKECVKHHLKYIEYVLRSENLEVAYKKWVKEVIKMENSICFIKKDR